MKRTSAEMAAELSMMIHAKRKWLDDHKKSWPQWDVEQKKKEIEVLTQAMALYRKLMEK